MGDEGGGRAGIGMGAWEKQRPFCRESAAIFPSGLLAPVQENGLAAFQADEHGVNELHQLGEGEQKAPEARSPVSVHPFRGRADCLLEGVRSQEPKQVGDDAEGAQDGERRQQEVPVGEGCVALGSEGGRT